MKTDFKNEYASCQVLRNPELPPEMDRVREVVKVYTHPDHRKQGYATELMQSVCEEADAHGIVLMLQPRAYDNGLKDLERWYKRFGFVRTQMNPVLMARAPSFRPRVTGVVSAIDEVSRGQA